MAVHRGWTPTHLPTAVCKVRDVWKKGEYLVSRCEGMWRLMRWLCDAGREPFANGYCFRLRVDGE